jgi:hypothetical protein
MPRADEALEFPLEPWALSPKETALVENAALSVIYDRLANGEYEAVRRTIRGDLLHFDNGRWTVGQDKTPIPDGKRDSTALVAVAWDRTNRRVQLIAHRIFQPSPEQPLDFELCVESTVKSWRDNFVVRSVYYDSYQMAGHRAEVGGGGRADAGVPAEPGQPHLDGKQPLRADQGRQPRRVP